MKKAKNFKFYKVNFLLIFFVSFIFCSLSLNNGFAKVNQAQEQSVAKIDQKIKELEEMKRGYEAKALKHDNQAQILQFREGELQTAKRHWKLAEDNRKIATRIQMQIDELKVQKLQLQGKKG